MYCPIYKIHLKISINKGILEYNVSLVDMSTLNSWLSTWRPTRPACGDFHLITCSQGLASLSYNDIVQTSAESGDIHLFVFGAPWKNVDFGDIFHGCCSLYCSGHL